MAAKDIGCKCIGTLEGGVYGEVFEAIRRVYGTDGISPTITANKGGHHEVKIALVDDMYANREPRVYEDYSPAIRAEREGLKVLESPIVHDDYIGRDSERNGYRLSEGVQSEVEKSYVSEKGVEYILAPKRGMATDINPNVAITLACQQNWTGSFISPDIDHIERSTTIGSTEPTDIYLKNGEKITSDDDTSHLRIRKLTPLECWRLMDFDDEDFYKAKAIESNTQLYAQAGNSIVVNCLVAIFGQMFEGKENEYARRFEK